MSDKKNGSVFVENQDSSHNQML